LDYSVSKAGVTFGVIGMSLHGQATLRYNAALRIHGSVHGMPTFDFRASNTRKLHFFPASLPDETLLSRLSRYHLLSAAREDEHTFQLLFSETGGQVNFAAAAPTPLRRLANQLPGQSRKNLGELLAFNTFVPLVAPILVSLEWHHPDPEFGEANFCQHCAVLDKYQFGFAYLHRAHQLPGVKACWVHGNRLRDGCPVCSKPFRQGRKFLSAPILPCNCGWNFGTAMREASATEAELNFSIEANNVFEHRKNVLSAARLIDFFNMHVDHGAFGMQPGQTRSVTSLTNGIADQLESSVSTEEVALAVSRLIRAGRAPDCWIANLNPDVLKIKSILRKTGDNRLTCGTEDTNSSKSQ
jgi:hypothetical protein